MFSNKMTLIYVFHEGLGMEARGSSISGGGLRLSIETLNRLPIGWLKRLHHAVFSFVANISTGDFHPPSLTG